MKKMTGAALVLVLLLVCAASADRGQIWPVPMKWSEDAQKGIILSNGEEQVLILSTVLKAEISSPVLEFIPFPSEPAVFPVEGDPFGAVEKLLAEKKIGMRIYGKGRNGGETVSVPSVAVTWEGKIGPHEITVIRIDDPAGFSDWVSGFFSRKNIQVEADLSGIVKIAGDYTERGYRYFVFHLVHAGPDAALVDPLAYRFASGSLYYPLKTSNIVGGNGVIDLVLLLPGSLGLRHGLMSGVLNENFDWRRIKDTLPADGAGRWNLSSSAKVEHGEILPVIPEGGDFFRPGDKIYLQALRYEGDLNFIGDLDIPLPGIPPYAFKHGHFINLPGESILESSGRAYYEIMGTWSNGEILDLVEAYRARKPEWAFPEGVEECVRNEQFFREKTKKQ